MMSRHSKLWAVILLSGLTACAQTEYVTFGEAGERIPNPASRTVMVEITDAYHDDYPDCVVVMPPAAAPGLKRFPELVEASLSLHLTRKIARVVSGAERDLAARRMAADLVNPDDLDAFMGALGCDAVVTSRVLGPGRTFAVVWSQVRIGLEVRMTRTRDRRLLWRARHIAERSEGGIPFSPLGVVVDGITSARFAADREIVDSVVDDAVRRIVASLPDAISFRTDGQATLPGQ